MGYPSVPKKCGINRTHHLYTRRLINLFSKDNKVFLWSIVSGACDEISPNSRRLSENRLWNHSAEKVTAKYEDGLHQAVEGMRSSGVLADQQLATEFFVCWTIKSQLAKIEFSHLTLKGVSPPSPPSESQLVRGELMSGYFVQRGHSGAEIRGVDQTHMEMQRRIDFGLKEIGGVRWSLKVASSDSFVAPRNAPKNYLLIPVAHDMMLVGEQGGSTEIDEYLGAEDEIKKLNRLVVENERDWVIARSKKTLEGVMKY